MLNVQLNDVATVIAQASALVVSPSCGHRLGQYAEISSKLLRAVLARSLFIEQLTDQTGVFSKTVNDQLYVDV